MKNLNTLNAQIEFGHDSAPTNNVQNQTADEIERLSAAGYRIIVGNNPYLNQAQKYAGRECIRISQVNSRLHGKCLRTIWAVK